MCGVRSCGGGWMWKFGFLRGGNRPHKPTKSVVPSGVASGCVRDFRGGIPRFTRKTTHKTRFWLVVAKIHFVWTKNSPYILRRRYFVFLRKNLEYTLRASGTVVKPFDLMVNLEECPSWRAERDSNPRYSFTHILS